MINHNSQLNLFKIRSHEFVDTKRTKATYKFNRFIDRHNQKKSTTFQVEPADVKYYIYRNRTHILLTYVPITDK